MPTMTPTLPPVCHTDSAGGNDACHCDMMRSMDEPHRILQPDSMVTGFVAGSAAGPIYVTSVARDPGSGLTQTTLSAVDLSGKVLWRRFFDGMTPMPRATNGGSVWLGHHGPNGAALEEIGRDGSAIRTIAIAHDPDEQLGAVVILPDGFCTAWTSGPPYRGARVDRRDADGDCIWSTAIQPDQIAHHCIMEASAETGWVSRPKKPWIPGTFQFPLWEPLLVSGDRIMASCQDVKSGLGVSYFLDTGKGRVINSTKPAHVGRKAILDRGEFLVGIQGYDEFATVQYNREGGETTRWPTHGAMLTDRTGKLLGIELDNRTAAQPRLRILERDGTLTDGPALTGYHTTHPALDRNGTAVFWRSGRLLTVDAELALHELFMAKDDRSLASSRLLLLEDGIVAFILGEELFIYHTTLGPLDDSVWPCGDCNLNGNPVAFAE
jgi:hypothetical protein